MKKIWSRILILSLAIIISVVALIRCRIFIYNAMEEQVFDNLKDVSLQNKESLEHELNTTYELLDSIANQPLFTNADYTSEEERQTLINTLQILSSLYNYKRAGIVTTDGICYSTDQAPADLSGEDVYLYGIQGLPNITGSLTDLLGTPEDINVFSVPIRGKYSEVKAILFVTYRTEHFNERLNAESFDGMGYSYIVDEDGTVVTESPKSSMYGSENVFDAILSYTTENTSAVEQLRTNMHLEKSGYTSVTTEGARYVYYTPLKATALQKNWYLYTIVPAQVLDEKSETVLYHMNRLLAVIFIVIVVLLAYFIWTYRKDEKKLRALAFTDPLTKGDNYSCFLHKLKAKSGVSGYMVSLDLSEFKMLNSICGIKTGDKVLKAIWNILSSNLRPDELAAHVAADRYVMFLSADTREELLERIHAISTQITTLPEQLNIIQVQPYFGIYQNSNLGNPEECYTRAVQAKKLAKSDTTKNWAFFDEVDVNKLADEKQLSDSFEKAIHDCEFEVWYQPKYYPSDRTIAGAEALVRWRKPDGSLIPPYRFIPLFERNGMIVTLDEYVFRAVCKQQKQWLSEGRSLFPISVNVSRASLHYDNIVQRYTDIINEYGIHPEFLPLEVTESATINNAQIQGIMADFRKAGFPLYLDDFGVGYSSLATLSLMLFDTLKLDKSLVDFIGDSNGEKLIHYTVKLAKSLGMKIIAEGVEEEKQVSFLQNIRCDEIQGYFFSKPLPLGKFEDLL